MASDLELRKRKLAARIRLKGREQTGTEVAPIDVLRGLNQGITLGLWDEGAAGLESLVDLASGATDPFMDLYDENLAHERSSLEAAEDANPLLMGLAEATGAAGPGLLVPGSTIPRLGARVADAAAKGTTAGTVYGFGTGEGSAEERIEDALMPALAGGAFSAVSPAIGNVAGKGVRALRRRRAERDVIRLAPSTKTLKKEANALYDVLDNSKVRLRSGDFDGFRSGLLSELRREGADKDLTPVMSKMMGRLRDIDSDKGVSIKKLHGLRRKFGVVRDSTRGSEKRLGSIAQRRLDDFVADYDPGPESPMSLSAVNAWGQAREVYSRAMKSQTLDKAIARGKGYQRGDDLGTSQAFSNLAKNPDKRLRGFSAPQKEAVGRVVEGTSLRNNMRALGRFGFGRGQQTLTMNPIVGLTGATALGTVNPVAGLTLGGGLMAGGYAGSRIANRETQRLASLARSLAATKPGEMQVQRLFSPELTGPATELQAPLLERLLRGGALPLTTLFQ